MEYISVRKCHAAGYSGLNNLFQAKKKKNDVPRYLPSVRDKETKIIIL